MRVWTLAWLSALGMITSSLAAAWLASPTAAANAATADRAQNGPTGEIGGFRSELSLTGPVELDARVGHRVVKAGESEETYLYFRAHARAGSAASAPLRIVLLLDRSGSMRGKRLANAIDAARTFVKELRQGDEISVFAYDTRVTPLLERTRIDSASRDRVLAKVSLTSASGNTCISCALDRAIDDLASGDKAVSHVLLLSDGEATAGEKTLEGFRKIAQRARERGIGVSSVGVDVDYNEALLSTIARFSNGRHHFAKTGLELERAFELELGELSRPVATESVLDVDLADGVEIVETFDREVERQGNHLRVHLGTMTSEDEKTLLVKIRIPAGAPREALAAKFAFAYSVPGSNSAPTTATGELGIKVSDRLGEVSEIDPLVAARIGRSRTGALLFEAGKLFKSGNPNDFKALDEKLDQELGRSVRSRAEVEKDSPKAAKDFDDQQKALSETRSRLRISRGGHCGCATNDLSCAIRCSATSGSKTKSSCMPGDPLCGDVGTDLSRDEKAAAKESVEKSDPWSK